MVALLKMPTRNIAEAEGAERRMFPRRDVCTRVTSRRLDHSVCARQMPFLSLTVRDLSLGGLSAASTMPLEAGERLSFAFPADHGLNGWDAVGRVIRCQPIGSGYRVAVEFDPLPAA
jgi:hypothetical protein